MNIEEHNVMDVSVIIPAFNAAHTIAASIASIKSAQKEYKIEIIVIDDSSTDETWQTLMQLKESIPELMPIKNSRKKGPSGARNSGLDMAKGEFIAFLDADDVWYENHLTLGIDYLTCSPFVDAILFNQKIEGLKDEGLDWFGERTIVSKLFDGYDKDLFIKSLIHESFFHFQSVVLRRQKIGELRLNEAINRHEDRDFCVRFAHADNIIHVVNTITGVYFRTANNLTEVSLEADIRGCQNKVKVLQGFAADLIGDVSQLYLELYQTYIVLAYLYRKSGQQKRSFESIFFALKYKFSFNAFFEGLKTTISYFR